MATRPSPASDAAIRAQYYRSKRKSPEAQETADRLDGRKNDGVSTMAISRWNRGEDPALRKISTASARVSPRGFTAAAARGGRDKAAAQVSEALNAELSEGLPPSAGDMLERRKDRLRKDFSAFAGDADEYSGRPKGDYSSLLPPQVTKEEQEARKAERAVQRQGVSAQDYWERNPESKRTAVVKNWSGNPEVAKAIATGESTKIEAAIKKAKAEGGRTASISADGEVTQTGNAGPRVRVVNVADLNEDMQADRLAQKTKRSEQQEKLAEFRKDMVEKRKENERVSRDRFDDFVVAQDQRKTDKAKSEAYLKNFDRQARAMRRAAIGNSYSGKEGAPGFWERNDEIQATAQNLRRMSQEERLKWANSQVKADEEARAAQVTTASKPSAVTEEQLAEFFNRPVTLTDFINTFFGGGRK
jgi:hypothetical protein